MCDRRSRLILGDLKLSSIKNIIGMFLLLATFFYFRQLVAKWRNLVEGNVSTFVKGRTSASQCGLKISRESRTLSHIAPHSRTLSHFSWGLSRTFGAVFKERTGESRTFSTIPSAGKDRRPKGL